MRREILVAACLPLFSAAAFAMETLGEPDETLARQSIQKIEAYDLNSTNWEAIIRRWTQKCGNSENACALSECDASPENCREGRVLLFRGEDQRFQTPAVSGLLQSRWSGGSYAPNARAQGLLQTLKDDVAILRPIGSSPQGDELMIVKTADGMRRWEYKDGSAKKPHIDRHGRLTFQQILYAFHVEASVFYFRDPALGKPVSLDPLISFTLSPETAFAFACEDPKHCRDGVVIIASVPTADLSGRCGEDIPAPGKFLGDCGISDEKNEYSDESEVDAVLYVHPDYIWKSLRVTH